MQKDWIRERRQKETLTRFALGNLNDLFWFSVSASISNFASARFCQLQVLERAPKTSRT